MPGSEVQGMQRMQVCRARKYWARRCAGLKHAGHAGVQGTSPHSLRLWAPAHMLVHLISYNTPTSS